MCVRSCARGDTLELSSLPLRLIPLRSPSPAIAHTLRLHLHRTITHYCHINERRRCTTTKVGLRHHLTDQMAITVRRPLRILISLTFCALNKLESKVTDKSKKHTALEDAPTTRLFLFLPTHIRTCIVCHRSRARRPRRPPCTWRFAAPVRVREHDHVYGMYLDFQKAGGRAPR